MAASAVRLEHADDLDELIDHARAGRIEMLMDQGQPVGVVLPFPSDPEKRIREAAALLRAGVIGSSTAARIAGCDGVGDFILRCGALSESIVGEQTMSEDLDIASRLIGQMKRG